MKMMRRSRPDLLLLILLLTVGAAATLAAPWRYANDAATPDGAFVIHFQCASPDSAFCAGAERVFHAAAARIGSALKFRRAVVVDVRFSLPCGTTTPDPQTCAEAAYLGSAAPAQRIPVVHGSTNATFLYPTALLKQLDVPGIDQVVWPAYDISANFNALKKWYLGNGPMAPDDRVLEYTATHELLHGLGFGDDVIVGGKAISSSLMMPFWDPSPGPVAPVGLDLATTDTMYRLALPTAWNAYTATTTGLASRILDLYAAVARAVPPGKAAVADVARQLAQDDVASQAMRELYSIATTNQSLQLRFPSWVPLGLATQPPSAAVASGGLRLETSFNPYRDGSSAAHTASGAAIEASPDFLMVWQIRPGREISDVARATGSDTGIGPGTLAALVSLGYTPRGMDGWISVPGALINPTIVAETVKVNSGAGGPDTTRDATGGSSRTDGSSKTSGATAIEVPRPTLQLLLLAAAFTCNIFQ